MSRVSSASCNPLLPKGSSEAAVSALSTWGRFQAVAGDKWLGLGWFLSVFSGFCVVAVTSRHRGKRMCTLLTGVI